MKKLFSLILVTMFVVSMSATGVAFAEDLSSLQSSVENNARTPFVAEISNQFVKANGDEVYIPVVVYTVDPTRKITLVGKGPLGELTGAQYLTPNPTGVGLVTTAIKWTAQGMGTIAKSCRVKAISTKADGSDPITSISQDIYVVPLAANEDNISPIIPAIASPLEVAQKAQFHYTLTGHRGIAVDQKPEDPSQPPLPEDIVCNMEFSEINNLLGLFNSSFYHTSDTGALNLGVIQEDTSTPVYLPIDNAPGLYNFQVSASDQKGASTIKNLLIRVRPEGGCSNTNGLSDSHPLFDSLKNQFMAASETREIPVEIYSINPETSLEIVAVTGLPDAEFSATIGNGRVSATIKWTAPAVVKKTKYTCQVVARSTKDGYTYISIGTFNVLTNYYTSESAKLKLVPEVEPIEAIIGNIFNVNLKGIRVTAPPATAEVLAVPEITARDLRCGGTSSIRNLQFDKNKGFTYTPTTTTAILTTSPTPAPKAAAELGTVIADPVGNYILNLVSYDHKGALTVNQRYIKVKAS